MSAVVHCQEIEICPQCHFVLTWKRAERAKTSDHLLHIYHCRSCQLVVEIEHPIRSDRA